MPRTAISLSAALMGLALILVPALAYAGLAALDPLVLEGVSPRAGDVYRYRIESEDVTRENVLVYEGAGTVSDGWGRQQAVDLWVLSATDEAGETTWAEKCASLAGGREPVRRDHLAGGPSGQGAGSWSMLLGSVEQTSTANVKAAFGGGSDCTAFTLFPPFALSEGERYAFGDILGEEADGESASVLSLPTERTSIHGRDALRISYPVADLFDVDEEDLEGSTLEGSFDFVYAEGLAVLVEAVGSYRLTSAEGTEEESFAIRLVGFAPGDGPERAADVGLTLEPPAVEMRAFDPLALDDDGLDLPYPYAEAFAALLADPMVGLADFLADHPGAHLGVASYDRSQGPSYATAVPSEHDGRWHLYFVDEDAAYYATSTRGRAPVAGLPLATWALTENQGTADASLDFGELDDFEPPAQIAATRGVAALAPAEGLSLESVVSVGYAASSVYGRNVVAMTLSQVPFGVEGEFEGLTATLDLTTGALAAISTQSVETRSSGPLPSALDREAPDVARGDVSAFSALVGPVPGSGLAAAGAAATGLALLVLALKLGLVPFYSRLVRDRILDNPVRAQLFARVRAEPGIRRQELIDFANVGEGATRRHLDALAKHGFVVELHEGSGVSYYAAGDVPPALARKAAVLRSPATRRVYDLYAAEPSVSLREAAARLGVSAPGVHRQKRKLEKAGLLPAAPAEFQVALANS